MPRMARISLLIALAGTALGAAAPSSAQAAECPGDARIRDVRVQLWIDRGCAGAWIEIPFGGDGDRADFGRFEHSDGDEYDVDDNRSSAAVAPGTCVRFFYDTGFRRPATGLRCARQHELTMALPDGVSSMRACTRWTHSLCRGRSGASGRRRLGAPLGRPIERFDYDRPGAYPGSCTGAALPGTLALARLIAARWHSGSLRLGYACVEASPGIVDVHGEGRALDWRLRARSPHDLAIGNGIVTWLLADDRRGNRHARARRLGVQEIAWNGRVWTSSRWRAGLRPIRRGDRRRRWLHIALTREGARQRTSYWR
jgi:hypothetical protein